MNSKIFWTAGLLILFLSPSLQRVFAAETEADEPRKLQLSGHFRLRAEGDERTDFSSNRDFMSLRLRPEIRYRHDAQATLVFTPQFARTLGEPTFAASPSTGATSRTQTSGGTTDPSLGVHEAYLLYVPTPWMTLKAGRQVLSYGDELVIGALEWNNVGRSFDAVKARLSTDFGWTDVFVSKLQDNNTVAGGMGDVDLYGIYNSFDLQTLGATVDVYGLYLRDASAAAGTRLGAAGARLSGKGDWGDARLEGTKEMGTFGNASQAHQLDAEVGHTFAATPARPRLSGEYFLAGKSYNQLYPTTHKWLGYADVLGRRNLTGFAVHGEAHPAENWKLGLDYHQFYRVSDDATAFKVNGVTALGNTATSDSKSVGSEWDLTLAYKYSTALTLSGGASRFEPGDFLKAQYGDVHPTFYYVQAQLIF